MDESQAGSKGDMVNQSRRSLLLGAGASLSALALAGASRAQATAVMTEDGYYREDWFIDSFLELADDLEAAGKHGKRFGVVWELRGCPYCKEMHLVNFARPDIKEFVSKNFDLLPLNILGSRKVTDFDGEELSEKALAAKYGVKFTPTIQFFPDSVAGLKALAPQKREVMRIPGYLKPDDFLDVFRFVQQKSYGTKSFREFLKSERS
jgi:thioredoxin-related protein